MSAQRDSRAEARQRLHDFHPYKHKRRIYRDLSCRRTHHQHTYRFYGILSVERRSYHRAAHRHAMHNAGGTTQPDGKTYSNVRQCSNNTRSGKQKPQLPCGCRRTLYEMRRKSGAHHTTLTIRRTYREAAKHDLLLHTTQKDDVGS